MNKGDLLVNWAHPVPRSAYTLCISSSSSRVRPLEKGKMKIQPQPGCSKHI